MKQKLFSIFIAVSLLLSMLPLGALSVHAAIYSSSNGGTFIDGTFESGLSGWQAYSGTERSTQAARSGHYGVHLKGNGGWTYMLTQDFTVTPGAEYTLSFDLKLNSEKGINVSLWDIPGGASTYTAFQRHITCTTWETYSFDFTPTVSTLWLVFGMSGMGVAEDAYVDNIILKKHGSVSNEGSSSNGGAFTNGTFESGSLTGWNANFGTSISTAAAYSGNYGVHLKGVGNGGWGHMLLQDFTITPGCEYELTLDLKLNSDCFVMIMLTDTYYAGGSSFSQSEMCQLRDYASWNKVTIRFTPTVSLLWLEFIAAGSQNVEDAYVDNISVQLCSSSGDSGSGGSGSGSTPQPTPTPVNINSDFAFLAQYYPTYLKPNVSTVATSASLHGCNNVIQNYSKTHTGLLAFAESFVNGSEIIVKEIASSLGIGQSVEEEWLQKNTLEYVRNLQNCEDAVYDAWSNVKKAYDGFSMTVDTIKTSDDAYVQLKKTEFISKISGHSSCFSQAEATELANRLIEESPNNIEDFFSKADAAVDLADVMLLTCQMMEAEVTTLKRLQSSVSTSSPLYRGISSLLDAIEDDPVGWAVEKYLSDQAVDYMIENVFDKVADWSAGVLAGADVSVVSAVVRLTANILYNFVYQGAKIDELYGAIVAYDFYTSVSTAYTRQYNTILTQVINNKTVSTQMMQDFIFLYEAKRVAMVHYINACIAIDNGDYTSNLKTSRDYFEDDGELSFDNFISWCMKGLKNDIAAGVITCSHIKKSWVQTVYANCTMAGYDHYSCDLCNAIIAQNVVDALGHNYAVQSVIAPGCSTQGYTTYCCTRCFVSYSGAYTNATGHTYSNACDASCNTCGAVRTVGKHVYDNAYDAQCNVCGMVRDVAQPGDNYSHNVQHSVMDTDNGNGLAFRFELKVNGINVINRNRVDLTHATIDYLGTPCKLLGMGTIITNNGTIGNNTQHFTHDSVNETSVIDIPTVYLWDWKTDTCSFAARLVDIPTSALDCTIYARPYYVVEVNGEAMVVYGNINAAACADFL